jgi:hypothetical protein
VVGGQAADQDCWDGDGEDAEEHGDSSAIHVPHMPKAAPRTAINPPSNSEQQWQQAYVSS